MAVRKFYVQYGFHPVGQGLFSYGFLGDHSNEDAKYCWVYDCGSVSAQSFVDRGIAGITAQIGGEVDRGDEAETESNRPVIEVVFLSHFDADHISGMVKLIKGFTIRSLVLPYVPLWQRLIIAFSEDISVRSPWMSFFVNPLAFLNGVAGSDIRQIVFVPSSEILPPPDDLLPASIDTDQPADDMDYLMAQKRNAHHTALVFEPPPVPADNGDQQADLAALTAISSTGGLSVVFMPLGGRLLLGNGWEFVPYNDAHLLPKVTPIFTSAVAAVRSTLLMSPDTSKLNALKKLYDEQFGSTAVRRNQISLFLYGGPIDDQANLLWHSRTIKIEPDTGRLLFPVADENEGDRVGAILYTGDGYLNTEPRINGLFNYLGTQRMEKIFCFQVMHHGSERNWMPGLAARIAPNMSVFSSDPKRRGTHHPHASVKKDFELYGPTQVDKKAGAHYFVEYSIDN